MVEHARLFSISRRPAIGAALRTVGHRFFISAAVLLLAGCEFFAQSPFPGYLPGLKESADVSGILEDPRTHDIQLFTMPRPNGDVVFLLQRSFESGEETVTAFNDELEPRGQVTGWFGELRMVDLPASYLVGDYRFDALTLQGTYDPAVSFNDFYMRDRFGFSNFADTTYTMQTYPSGGYSSLNLSSSPVGNWPSMFYIDPFPLYGFYEVRITDPPDGRLFHLGSVFYFKDHVQSQGFAVITLIADSGVRSWAIIVRDDPGDHIDGVRFPDRIFTYFQAHGALIERPPEFDSSGELLYASFPIGDNLRGNVAQITADGIVVETDREEEMRLVEFGTGRILDTEIDPSSKGSFVQAYSTHGDHYYLLDLLNKRLYKANTWWR